MDYLSCGRSSSPRHALSGALAGTGVRTGALTAHGKTFPMAKASVGAEIHQALDALLHLSARVTLDLDVALDRLADRPDIGFTELVDLLVLRDAGNLAELARP